MDILIIYERKNRELENALLMKFVFEREGYTCRICQSYEVTKLRIIPLDKPKILILPSLYNDKALSLALIRFGCTHQIINMQYEQVLSKKWEALGHHTPKGEATKAYHVCWGPGTANRLRNAGIPKLNIKTIGAIQTDLLRKEFRNRDNNKKDDYAKRFNLPTNRTWTLFLSSFTYADIADDRLKINENVVNASLKDFPSIHTKSRNKILEWFEFLLKKDSKGIFIYRPHPDELNLEPVKEIEKKFSNFKIIDNGSAKTWIALADKIYSWYSTTIVEAHFLEKPYSILRPYQLPENFDSVLLKNGSFIESIDEFQKDYLQDYQSKYSISDEFIKEYYIVDSAEPTFSKLIKIVDEIISKNHKNNFRIDKIYALKYMLLNILIYFIFRYAKNTKKIEKNGAGGIFKQIISEVHCQLASTEEKNKISNMLIKILAK